MQSNTTKIQGFQLSAQQKRLWLLQTQENNNPYQVKCSLVIEGLLDIQKIQEAWRQVIKRHEILRTDFKYLSGMTIPLQVITDENNLFISSLNISKVSVENKNEYINNFFKTKDNKISLSLASVSQMKHILLISLPALCGDTRSLQTLVTEISYYYQNLNSKSEINNEPMQYADFAEWQNELLEAKDTEVGRKYWEEQNYYAFLYTTLPREKQVSNNNQFKPQVIGSLIDCECLAQITKLTTEYKISVSSFLFTCWQILIYRLTKQPNLVIGVSDDGRKYEELKSTIGLITKYLPIQNHLEANISSNKLLQVNYTLLQEAERKQEYFNWDNSASLSVAFEFIQNYQLENLWEISKIYSCSDRFKLKLASQQKDDSLDLSFYYDANLFRESDIQYLADQFDTLVTSIINNLTLSVSQLKILSESQKQKILIDFNNTKTSFFPLATIQQKFERQVAKTPNEIALIHEEQQLTYQQLNQRANQLAHYLRKQEIVAEDLVAIYLKSSLDVIIGLLGILKAGAAYIPLDPNLPLERLSWMMEDTQAKVILTQQQLISNLPKLTASIICLDSQSEIIQQENNRNLNCNVQPENLAYVIYTSGSTGKPKKVAIEHRQIFNYSNSILEKINPNNGASFAMVSTLAADLGNTMLFPALCTGGCLHLMSYECVTDGEALGKYFQQHQIDYLKITPSHLTALLLSPQPELVLPRQTLILGGEVLNWSLVSKIRSLASNCIILNHYGPTETTVGVLTYEIDQETGRKRDREIDSDIYDNRFSNTVPVGKPLPNNQVYVLDKNLQPVPIGVPGEIYIGGMQVGRGYLNQPELTKKKFITNPFIKSSLDGEKEERLYKTGDLGKYLPNGNIEFLGRIDRQVKISGFRIELGEIESTLEQHFAVQQTVVIFQEDNQRLISYITAKTNFSPPNSADLRDFLAAKLPEYAIPTIFICLKEFPLTANGKIDRQRLPTPETISPELSATFVAPETATEKAIADIWLEILNVRRVGIHDDFFELGGHSLLATQVVSRIRQILQTELSLRQFFDFPTVAGLTTIIAQNLAMQTDEEVLATMLAELEQLPESILAEEGKNE